MGVKGLETFVREELSHQLPYKELEHGAILIVRRQTCTHTHTHTRPRTRWKEERKIYKKGMQIKTAYCAVSLLTFLPCPGLVWSVLLYKCFACSVLRRLTGRVGVGLFLKNGWQRSTENCKVI